MTPESYNTCSSRQWMGLQKSSVGFWVCFSLSSTPPSNTLMYGPKSKPVKHRWKHPQVKSDKEDVQMPLYCSFDCWVSSTGICSSFGGLASWEEQAPAGPLLAPYKMRPLSPKVRLTLPWEKHLIHGISTLGMRGRQSQQHGTAVSVGIDHPQQGWGRQCTMGKPQGPTEVTGRYQGFSSWALERIQRKGNVGGIPKLRTSLKHNLRDPK